MQELLNVDWQADNTVQITACCSVPTRPNPRRRLLTLETGRATSCSQLYTDFFVGFQATNFHGSVLTERRCFGKAKGCCYHGNSSGACNASVHFAVSTARSSLHVAAWMDTIPSLSQNVTALIHEGWTFFSVLSPLLHFNICTFLVSHLQLLRVFVCVRACVAKKTKTKLTWPYLQREIGESASSNVARQTPSVLIRRLRFCLPLHLEWSLQIRFKNNQSPVKVPSTTRMRVLVQALASALELGTLTSMDSWRSTSFSQWCRHQSPKT